MQLCVRYNIMQAFEIKKFLAHPVGFEPTASAFGEWIIGSAETIQFYPIARYATEITKQN